MVRHIIRRLRWAVACLAPLAALHCTSSPRAGAPAADSGTIEMPNTSADAAASRPAPSTVPSNSDAALGDAGQAGAASTAPSAAGMHAGMAASDGADAGMDVDADSGVAPAPSEDSSCLDSVTSYASAGPFSYQLETTEARKFWVPKVPAGCKVPVVHFANGTGATCANYQSLLERFASHGFLTVCAENPNTGSGVPGLQALEATLARYPELAAHKLGSAGHEAGGQGALLTLRQAESKWGTRATYAGLAVAPTSGHGSQPPGGGSWQDDYAALKSPLFFINGGADGLVSEAWVGDGFEALGDAVEAYWFTAVDAPHIPIPLERLQQVSIAWFRWKLLGDAQACSYFKQLPDGPDWDARAEQNAKACR